MSADRDFPAFVVAHEAALLRTAWLLTGDRGHAEDLVQTALAKLYVAWPRLVRHGALHGYAKQVVVRAFLDERRRPWRREHPAAELPEGGADPYGAVDERDRLRRAVATLPPRQRRLLDLLVASPPVSYEQISAGLGMPLGSIGPTRARALARLRTALEAAGLHDPALQ